LNQTQPSPDADDDWDAKATEALEAARLMPAGKEKCEALERAGLLRKAVEMVFAGIEALWAEKRHTHKPFPAKKRGRPAKHTQQGL